MELWNASPDGLLGAMREAGLRRAYMITDPRTQQLRASHSLFDSVVRAVREDRRDYHQHEGCFFEIGRESGHLLAAFVHKTRRGQGAGGVRFWGYERIEDFVRDGLRLSRGMGHKCALAGLWWGGGKGVIARRPGVDRRCLEVFDRAERSARTPAEEAEALADELAEQLHPIWGHRGQQIIDHLVAAGRKRA